MALSRDWLWLLALCVCCLPAGRCSSVLILSPMGTKSHVNYYGEMASTLLHRGHQVTLVSSHAISDHDNLTQIRVDLPMEKFAANMFHLGSPAYASYLFTSVIPEACTDALLAEDIQRLDAEEFDLVMAGYFTTECFLSLLFQKKVPTILFMVNNIQASLHESVGNIEFPSSITAPSSEAHHPMGFRGRLSNLAWNLASRLRVNHIARHSNLKQCQLRGACPREMTSYMDVDKNSSLLFVNNVRTLDEPARPYMPGVINIGGLHCRPAKPLPQDLEEWASSSGEDGFIYFSLGSAARPSDMPDGSRRLLLEVFQSLPFRVLWKWNEDTIEGLPPNVKLSKWLPQQDILGHPKLRLFISHGGLFSLQEAIYHGVPVLGMPIFLDQFTNVDKMVVEGWGERAYWTELDEDTLRRKIVDLITDKRYSTEVQRRSALMRDQLVSPREEVAYWTEYVIRHKGAPHLRSPVHDMFWYEVYNVDVWLFIVSVCSVTSAVLLLLCAGLLCCCRRGSPPQQRKRKIHQS